MSRPSEYSARNSFASRTAFDALAVESADEDEEVEVVPQQQPNPSSTEPPKISKSQLRKAAKTARTERRKRLKAAGKAEGTDSHHSHSTDEASLRTPSPLVDDHLSHNANGKSPLLSNSEPIVVLDDDPAPPTQINGFTTVEAKQIQPIAESDDDEKTAVDLHEHPSPPTKVDTKSETAQNGSVEQVSNPELESQEAERRKKTQNLLTRTLWTFIMIGGFMGLLLLGHGYMIILVMLCQTVVYREVTALFSLTAASKESVDGEKADAKDPWSKTLNWYFFAVTNYFLYGESIIYYFKHVVFTDVQLLVFATNHRIISFTLYTIGFVGFVMSLKKGYLKQQFGLFCWVHMSLLLIVVSSHFIVNNILEGLIWFWVPACLVICNDVFAYIWGITIGHTPLIKLSPKKTVEGFVGAFWSTLILGVLWGTYFMRFDYMICPVHDLGVSAWSNVTCNPNPVFIWKEWEIWAPLRLFLSTAFGVSATTIPYAPYQIHLVFMSIFASLVAPFGGFFASGFKRAFDIKDFGHSIPGHGGMTDRMDCQFLMGVFTYVYYSSLIREHHVTVGSILQMIVSGLTLEDQLELMKDFKKYLQGRGIST